MYAYTGINKSIEILEGYIYIILLCCINRYVAQTKPSTHERTRVCVVIILISYLKYTGSSINHYSIQFPIFCMENFQ